MKMAVFFISLMFFCSPSLAFLPANSNANRQAGLPQRIVSGMPSNTEIITALGLDNQLVGITDLCNYPRSIARKPRVGANPLNAEKIVHLNPDLVVLLSDAQMNDVAHLKQMKLPVYTVNPHSFADVKKSIVDIGTATGRLAEAKKLVASMEERIKKILATVKVANAASPKVFVEIWHDPLTTAAQGTFINDLIKLAGGTNIAEAANQPYPQFSPESLIAADPDVIIVPVEQEKDKEQMYRTARWKNLKAVRNNNILFIDADLLSRPGPRLADAFEIITKFLYPKASRK